MRAFVLVEWGPQRWRKAAIEAGETLRVGRFESAGLAVPSDEALSGLHVEIRWDGARGFLRDLSSMGGTFLNGEPAVSGEIAHGDWFRAGSTVFSFYVEGCVPPWSPPAGVPAATPERKAQALAALRAEDGRLYAVLDAAREARVLALLRATLDEAQSLYEGREGEELAEVAPYLVALPRGTWLLERLVDEGWGRSWGIFLACPRPFKEVRRHLRRLLVGEVKETAERFSFRFYDPRVLGAAAPLCTPRQRLLLFGEIEAFLLEGEAAEIRRLAC